MKIIVKFSKCFGRQFVYEEMIMIIKILNSNVYSSIFYILMIVN